MSNDVSNTENDDDVVGADDQGQHQAGDDPGHRDQSETDADGQGANWFDGDMTLRFLDEVKAALEVLSGQPISNGPANEELVEHLKRFFRDPKLYLAASPDDAANGALIKLEILEPMLWAAITACRELYGPEDESEDPPASK